METQKLTIQKVNEMHIAENMAKDGWKLQSSTEADSKGNCIATFVRENDRTQLNG